MLPHTKTFLKIEIVVFIINNRQVDTFCLVIYLLLLIRSSNSGLSKRFKQLYLTFSAIESRVY